MATHSGVEYGGSGTFRFSPYPKQEPGTRPGKVVSGMAPSDTGTRPSDGNGLAFQSQAPQGGFTLEPDLRPAHPLAKVNVTVLAEEVPR